MGRQASARTQADPVESRSPSIAVVADQGRVSGLNGGSNDVLSPSIRRFENVDQDCRDSTPGRLLPLRVEAIERVKERFRGSSSSCWIRSRRSSGRTRSVCGLKKSRRRTSSAPFLPIQVRSHPERSAFDAESRVALMCVSSPVRG